MGHAGDVVLTVRAAWHLPDPTAGTVHTAAAGGDGSNRMDRVGIYPRPSPHRIPVVFPGAYAARFLAGDSDCRPRWSVRRDIRRRGRERTGVRGTVYPAGLACVVRVA